MTWKGQELTEREYEIAKAIRDAEIDAVHNLVDEELFRVMNAVNRTVSQTEYDASLKVIDNLREALRKREANLATIGKVLS